MLLTATLRLLWDRTPESMLSHQIQSFWSIFFLLFTCMPARWGIHHLPARERGKDIKFILSPGVSSVGLRDLGKQQEWSLYVNWDLRIPSRICWPSSFLTAAEEGWWADSFSEGTRSLKALLWRSRETVQKNYPKPCFLTPEYGKKYFTFILKEISCKKESGTQVYPYVRVHE